LWYCGRFRGMQFAERSASDSVCQQDVPCGCKVAATKQNTVIAGISLILKCVPFGKCIDYGIDN